MKIRRPQLAVTRRTVGEVNHAGTGETGEQCGGPNRFVIGMPGENGNPTIHEIGLTAGRTVKLGRLTTLRLTDGTAVDVTIEAAGK